MANNRDFYIYDADNHFDFIGAFCTTEPEAIKKAKKIIVERNELRKQYGSKPHKNIFVKSAYNKGEKNIEFNFTV